MRHAPSITAACTDDRQTLLGSNIVALLMAYGIPRARGRLPAKYSCEENLRGGQLDLHDV